MMRSTKLPLLLVLATLWLTATAALAQEPKPGTVKRGFLGVALLDMSPSLRAHMAAPRDAGVLVSDVSPSSPAEKAGLKVGDVVTKVDGTNVESAGELEQRVRGKSRGQNMTLDVIRDRSARQLGVTLDEREVEEDDMSDFFGPAGPVGPVGPMGRLTPEMRTKMKARMKEARKLYREAMADPLRNGAYRDAIERLKAAKVRCSARIDEKVQRLQHRLDELERRLGEKTR